MQQHRRHVQLRLAGRASANGITETDIAPRIISLDGWAVQVLDAWRTERSIRRRVHDEDSMLYNGAQGVTSTSRPSASTSRSATPWHGPA